MFVDLDGDGVEDRVIGYSGTDDLDGHLVVAPSSRLGWSRVLPLPAGATDLPSLSHAGCTILVVPQDEKSLEDEQANESVVLDEPPHEGARGCTVPPVPKDEAEEIKTKIEEAGGQVDIK